MVTTTRRDSERKLLYRDMVNLHNSPNFALILRRIRQMAADPSSSSVAEWLRV